MAARASNRAVQIMFAAAIVAASASPVSAQLYEPLLYAYGELSRPLKYLRGRASPYIDRKADFYGGIDASKTNMFAWAGMTFAPTGLLIEDGWRVRVMGGAGRYSYNSGTVPGGINDANVFSGELLGGYRKTFDNVFGTKVYVGSFAGIFYEDQMLQLTDPFHPTQGSETGIKASLEAYARIRDKFIVTGFATAASVHKKYYVKATALYEFNEQWAIGSEVATMGDARHSENRIGLAGSFTWNHRIFALSGGALDNSGRGAGTYLTFSVYTPF